MIPGLTDSEYALFIKLQQRLNSVQTANIIKQSYYEASQSIENIGIAMPPEIVRRLKAVMGWAGTVVDVLEERIDLLGWSDPAKLGLSEIFTANALDLDAPLAHTDALIYGTSFIRVGTGQSDEPPILVTVHSPTTTTGLWDTRSRRLVGAWTVEETRAWLDVPGSTISMVRPSATSQKWAVIDRDDHNFPYVPVVRMVNRPRSGHMEGRSEITRAVRYYCEAAIRTAAGMEINREFYSIPQLVLMGRGKDAFVDGNGKPTSGWKILAGHGIAIDRDEDGNVPKMEQLTVSSPTPFLQQLEGWSQLLAAEAGMPTSYLGLLSENPSSADAIRAGEARLVKRAERRQTTFGRSWRQVAELALLMRDGKLPDGFERIEARWRDASTPTVAATADATTKYVTSGILLPTSEVTMNRIGLSPSEQETLKAERSAAPAAGADLLASALNRQQQPTTDQPSVVIDPDQMKALFESLGVAIRAGVIPESAAAKLGLDGMKFTGAVPVSLRVPESTADELEQR